MIFEEDGGQEEERQRWEVGTNGNGSSNRQEIGTDYLKRTRTTDELGTLGVIPSGEAWQLQGVVTDLLAAADTAAPNGLKKYIAGRSLVVLCVLEHVDIHYRLLCSALPALQTLSPTLQPLLLTNHDPAFASTHLQPAPSFPVLSAKGHPQNHLLKLGLLHPLGGGQAGMDALVVLDAVGRRRLVLPFGWGAGKHVGENVVGGSIVRDGLMEVLARGVEELEREMR